MFFKLFFKAPASLNSLIFDSSLSLSIILLVVSTPKSAVKRDVSKSSYNSSLIFLPVTKAPIPKAKFSLVLFNLSKKDTFSF